jgi:Zn-dependent protease with chaperone function
MTLPANYYDGTSSTRYPVSVSLGDNGMISIRGEGIDKHYAVQDIVDAQRLGSRMRIVKLRDKASLEVTDTHALDDYLDGHGIGRRQGVIHKLERKLKYVALAVVITALFAWGFFSWGVPAMARVVAYSLPVETQDMLGQGTLQVFDKYFMQPSELGPARQAQIRARFKGLIHGLEEESRYRLAFRNSEKLGANAFALPSGTIVITDELIRLAQSDYEIDAVLAHEIGHVHYRHSLRGALQSSASAVILAMMSGDLASMSSFAASLPTVILYLSYSRQFETEADGYARQLMLSKGIPLIHFANILTRLSQSHGGEDESVGFLSSHPATRERIQAFQ